MAVNSVLEGITEYFLKCPLLKDGVFRVDALGPNPIEYTIETGIFDRAVGWLLITMAKYTSNNAFMARN